MMQLQALARAINKTFKDRPSFIRFKVSVVGASILSIRCEGPILTDLAHDVAQFVANNRDTFGISIRPQAISCGWHMGGTVINFYIV